MIFSIWYSHSQLQSLFRWLLIPSSFYIIALGELHVSLLTFCELFWKIKYAKWRFQVAASSHSSKECPDLIPVLVCFVYWLFQGNTMVSRLIGSSLDKLHKPHLNHLTTAIFFLYYSNVQKLFHFISFARWNTSDTVLHNTVIFWLHSVKLHFWFTGSKVTFLGHNNNNLSGEGSHQ